jgi:hypothetical protein
MWSAEPAEKVAVARFKVGRGGGVLALRVEISLP